MRFACFTHSYAFFSLTDLYVARELDVILLEARGEEKTCDVLYLGKGTSEPNRMCEEYKRKASEEKTDNRDKNCEIH